MAQLEIAKSMDDPKLTSLGGGLLTLGGLAAAFGVASCCALPLLLASFGLGTAWLTGVALTAVPYRNPLLILSAIALAGGAILLWRQQRAAMTCAADGVCVPPAIRVLNLLGLVAGAVLLWAGYTYV
jgi:mercuric ion transport protein